MTASVAELLRCPVCGASGAISADGKSFFCCGEKRHCYDFSKSGYLNFSRDGKTGDAKAAVQARSAFLDAGYYQPLSDRVNELLSETGALTVLDAGCGEGYYTNRMTAPNRRVLGADLSREGIDHAAKVAKRTGNGAGFAVCSLFELPVADGGLDAVTCLFAPCAETEFCRVLRDGGYLLLVGAGEEHLMGLKRVLYDEPRINAGRADLPQHMTLVRTERLTGEITVAKEHIDALFSMTPYYWRTSAQDRKKLEGLNWLRTEYAFDIFLYRKDGNA